MQQQLRQTPQQKEEVASESKQKTEVSAAVSDISDDRITVDITRNIMTADARLVNENGEEKKILDFNEEEETSQHTLSLENQIYEKFKASAWDVVADILAETESAAATDAEPFTAWDLIHIHAAVPQITATGRERFAVPQPADTEPATSVSVIEPATERPFQDRVESAEHALRAAEVSYDVTFSEQEYDAPDIQADIDTIIDPEYIDMGTVNEFSAADTSYPVIHVASSGAELDADIAALLDEDGLQQVEQREHVVLATYDDAVNEHDTRARAVYEVDETLVDGDATVKDTLLELVDRGELDATIVKQPFYSDESFGAGDDTVEAGWQDGFYGVVQLEGMQIDMTEFSYGDDSENMDLSMEGIDTATVSSGDYVDFRASEEYTCGTVADDTGHRDAWLAEYGAFDEFDSATERGVYAAMMDEQAFEGSPLDLSLYENARDMYIEQVGTAPEDVFDNVVYEQ